MSERIGLKVAGTCPDANILCRLSIYIGTGGGGYGVSGGIHGVQGDFTAATCN